MADSNNTPVTFGATIEQPKPALTVTPLRTAPSNDSNLSATLTMNPSNKAEADPSNPFSPFYKYPNARRSMEDSAQHSKTDRKSVV